MAGNSPYQISIILGSNVRALIGRVQSVYKE